MDQITIPEWAKRNGVSRIAAFRRFKRLLKDNKELPGVASHTTAGRSYILLLKSRKKTLK